MPVLTATDAEVSTQLTAARDRLNAGSELALYVGNVLVTTATTVGALTEATYQGYARVDLAGRWGAPYRHQSGIWVTETDFFSFAVAAGPGPQAQAIRGAYVVAGTSLRFAGNLPGPVNLVFAGVPLEFRLRVELADSLVFSRLVFP